MSYRRYGVGRQKKEPLLRFILSSLEQCVCRVLKHSGAAEAPFRISFEAPDGERMGIVAYAFYANRRATKNRPTDFELVAACLHPQTEQWEFAYALTRDLDPHKKCPGRLSNLARIDTRWSREFVEVMERLASPLRL